MLDNPNKDASKLALKRLGETDKVLQRNFKQHLKDSDGYCRVLITGSPESFADRFLQGLLVGAEEFWDGRKGKKPAVLKALDKASADTANLTTTKVMALVSDLRLAVKKAGGKGVLVVIDELGKFLEYEARHYGANDIYLLQALAEAAHAESESRLLLFVLMHQGFEQYARALSNALRDEWSKVHGRFENIAFLEKAEQVLRVVAAAIEQDLDKAALAGVRKQAAKIATVLDKVDALPPSMHADTATELFVECYPLHPLTALILPVLCQKVAQNERTLFNYLGSQEPCGFRDSLLRLSAVGDWIFPAEVFDYFLLNQPATLSDPMTHRRWAEVITAIERLGDGSSDEAGLLRTIGLLNILGAQAGFKASKKVVGLVSPSLARSKKAAESLIDKSLVQYRRFSGEYRVWQGSDFDLDAAVEQAKSQYGQFDLAESLNNRAALAPVVVRRYSVVSGTLRCFYPVYIDSKSYARVPKESNAPRLFLFLAESQDDVDRFKTEVVSYFSSQDIVALYPHGEQLRNAVAETLALGRVQIEHQELNVDPVAMREFTDRIEAAQTAESHIIRGVIDRPSASLWWWSGSALEVATNRDLQVHMSKVLETVYSQSPIFRTELLNREVPSSSANGARKKLFLSLLSAPKDESFGIEKFPAEKGLYQAIFKVTQLHQAKGKNWFVGIPSKADDVCNVRPVFDAIDAFLVETEQGPLPWTVLDERLLAPPYGVKRGLLTTLYLIALTVHKNELALYEDGAYVPDLDEAVLERFLRKPHTFQIQRFRIEGIRASVFQEYAKALYDKPEQVRSVLSIARPLSKFVRDLPEYSRKTKSVSPRAQAIRNAIMYSKSPQKLVFEDLPEACGVDTKNIIENDIPLSGFAEDLMGCLHELKYAYEQLLQDQQLLLARVLASEGNQSLAELRASLVGRYRGLDKFAMETDDLAAFARRLTSENENDSEWLGKLLLFLGRTPPEKWKDADKAVAEVRLSDFGPPSKGS